MEDNFGTLVQEAKDRTVYRVFHAWLRLHLAACEHSVIIVRTLRKRRRRYMHTALARLRAKSLLGRRLHAVLSFSSLSLSKSHTRTRVHEYINSTQRDEAKS